MPMRVESKGHLVTVFLRESTEVSLQEKQERVECPVDLDQLGNVMGVEVEAPCRIFGPTTLDGLELVNVRRQGQHNSKTPKGRALRPHAQQRPPGPKGLSPWVSYDKTSDMLYVYVGGNTTGEAVYEISVPVECTFFFDMRNQMYRVDIPLDEVRKSRAIYL